MKQYLIKEDWRPQKLPVVYSEYITDQIQDIMIINQGNVNGLSALADYIDRTANHISNRAIAFGYGSNYTRESDNTTYVYYYGVTYRVVDGTDKTFVEIVWIDLNLDDFGLQENKKVDISRIITETINSYLRKNLLLAS
jgi:hypothetical protein